MSLREILTDSERKLLMKILDHRAAVQLNGFSKKFEKEILEKTGTQSLVELLSKLHMEIIHIDSPYDEGNDTIEYWLNDHRLKKFNMFNSQAVRILDLSSKKYLYINEANEVISGVSNDEFLDKGLLYTYSKIHPWDLFQLIQITRKVIKSFSKLTYAQKLNSRLNYDIRYRHPKRGYIRLLQNILPVSLTVDEKIAVIIIQTSDISELKISSSMQYSFGYWEHENFVTIFKEKTSAYGNILTDREIDVLKLTAKGYTSKEVADELFLSADTIRTHNKNMIQKLNAKNMIEVVRMAVTEGWI